MKLQLASPGLRTARLHWEDAVELQALLRACSAYFASAERRPVSPHEGEERIAEALGDRKQVLLGVRAQGLVGLLDLQLGVPEPATLTIALLLVHPEHRRRGHAAALVTELVRTAREDGVVAIHLGVRSGATGAALFWEQQGFAEAGRDRDVTEYVLTL